MPIGNILGETQAQPSAQSGLSNLETGSFTPSLVMSGVTFTYNFRKGDYQKIGDWVTVSIVIVVNTVTGNGGVTLGGLPYAIAADTAFVGAGAKVFSTPITFVSSFGNSALIRPTNNSPYGETLAAQELAGAAVTFTFSYKVSQ